MRLFKAFAFVALLVAAFAGGYVARASKHGAPAAAGRRVLYYVDPMHPAYTSDKPGIAPDCGMKLEPVYESQGPGSVSHAPSAIGHPPSAIHIHSVLVSIAQSTFASHTPELESVTGTTANWIASSVGALRAKFPCSSTRGAEGDEGAVGFRPESPPHEASKTATHDAPMAWKAVRNDDAECPTVARRVALAMY